MIRVPSMYLQWYAESYFYCGSIFYSGNTIPKQATSTEVLDASGVDFQPYVPKQMHWLSKKRGGLEPPGSATVLNRYSASTINV